MSGSTSRVRDIDRHYPSGWSKRKAKEDRQKKTQLAISNLVVKRDLFSVMSALTYDIKFYQLKNNV